MYFFRPNASPWRLLGSSCSVFCGFLSVFSVWPVREICVDYWMLTSWRTGVLTHHHHTRAAHNQILLRQKSDWSPEMACFYIYLLWTRLESYGYDICHNRTLCSSLRSSRSLSVDSPTIEISIFCLWPFGTTISIRSIDRYLFRTNDKLVFMRHSDERIRRTGLFSGTWHWGWFVLFPVFPPGSAPLLRSEDCVCWSLFLQWAVVSARGRPPALQPAACQVITTPLHGGADYSFN